MIILAHRGLWRSPDQKNSAAALAEAFRAGFGIETDLRDHEGQVVISHDPPTGDGLMTFDALLDLHQQAGGTAMMALNVKADGLQHQVKRALDDHRIPVDCYFMFDMAVPDSLGYQRLDLPCFTRQSEIEPVPAFLDTATGIWLDCFFGDWAAPDIMLGHLAQGRSVALVSPELHHRPHHDVWVKWKPMIEQVARTEKLARLMICTDFPEEAKAFFQ